MSLSLKRIALLAFCLAAIAYYFFPGGHDNQTLRLRGDYEQSQTLSASAADGGGLERINSPKQTENFGNEVEEEGSPMEPLCAGNLTGFLSDDSKGGAGQAKLAVYPIESRKAPNYYQPIATFSTENGGEFSAKLACGKYVLCGIGMKTQLLEPVNGTKIRTQGASAPLGLFEISKNETTNLLVSLNHGALVHGQAINTDNPKSSTFNVHLFRENDDSLVAWSMALPDSRAISSELPTRDGRTTPHQHGYFIFPRIEPGLYRLEISLIQPPSAPAFEPWIKSVWIGSENVDLGQLFVSKNSLLGKTSPPPEIDPYSTHERINHLSGGIRAESKTSASDDLLSDPSQAISDKDDD